MATFKTKAVGGRGMDFGDLDIDALADYDYWKADSSYVRLYDNPKNYTLFTGKGIVVKKSGQYLTDVTAGTVTKLELAIKGVKTLEVTGLNLKAAKIYDYFEADNSKGALAYLLSGNDKITGTKYADTLFGGKGKDTLYGGAGNDTLKGEIGNDTLIGGLGKDTLYGGKGADTFVFKSVRESTVKNPDTIEDFSRKQGDKIDLKGIDANTTKGGDQAFKFIGDDAFHNKAGELRYEKKGGDTYIYGDVNGDGKADFAIHVDAKIDFAKGDFIL